MKPFNVGVTVGFTKVQLSGGLLGKTSLVYLPRVNFLVDLLSEENPLRCGFKVFGVDHEKHF